METKKKLLKVAGVFAIVALIFVAVIVILKENQPPSEGMDSYDEGIVILNETHPVRILHYGDEIEFRPALKVERIDSITESVLAENKSAFERVALIINDFAGNTALDEDAFNAIKKGVDEGYLDFYYLGTTQIDGFIKHGLWSTPLAEDQLAIRKAYYGNRYFGAIIWTEYDDMMWKKSPQNLGQILVLDIVSNIKSVH